MTTCQSLTKALTLLPVEQDMALQRLSEAYRRANEAFAQIEDAVCSGSHTYDDFPESIFDVEYFELKAIRLKKEVLGQTSLARLIDLDIDAELADYEKAVDTYAAHMAMLTSESGITQAVCL